VSSRRIVWAWTAALSAVAALTLVLADSDSALRPAVLFWFLLVCPGISLVAMLDLESAWTELTLAIATSLALDTLVAVVMVETRLWSPTAGVLGLGVLTLLGAAVQLVAARRRTAPRAPALPAALHEDARA
jgi:hypothetical protein